MMNVSNLTVNKMSTRSNLSRSLHTSRGLEELEPYEGKLSRTVLRGKRAAMPLTYPIDRQTSHNAMAEPFERVMR